MSTEYEQKIRTAFPNLDYREFKLLDNKQERLGIDDLSTQYSKEKVKELAELFTLACKGFIYFYSAEYMSLSLNNQLDNLLERLNPERTLLVFPGNGAQAVKTLIRPEVFKFFGSLDLQVQRILSQDMSVSRVDILTGKTLIHKGLSPKLCSCVVIDDVLLTGTTAQSIRKFLDDRDNLEWYMGTWMSLSPLQSRPKRELDQFGSSLPGYRKVVTNILYQGISGIPANNSLSSFAEFDEKSNLIIDGYKRKYVEDLETFDHVIEALRRLKNE